MEIVDLGRQPDLVLEQAAALLVHGFHEPRERGALTATLGTDDDSGMTSLADVDLSTTCGTSASCGTSGATTRFSSTGSWATLLARYCLLGKMPCRAMMQLAVRNGGIVGCGWLFPSTNDPPVAVPVAPATVAEPAPSVTSAGPAL